MGTWFYYDKDNRVGPIDNSSLRNLVAQKVITPETIIENESGRHVKAKLLRGVTFPDLSERSSSPADSAAPVTPQKCVFCTYCGKILAQNARACTECGAAVGGSVTPNPLTAPTATAAPKKSQAIIENLEKYSEFTKGQDWKAICELNNVVLDSFATQKELTALPSYLDSDEVVFALTSGIMIQTGTSNAFDFGLNTWLVVLTNERFLFLDAAMLTSSVDTQSIRHDKVQAVSASQGWVFGKIMVDIGNRIVVIDNCKKETVKVMADLANKWIKELSKKKETIPQQATAAPAESALDKLEKLKKLHSIGALSDEEFTAAKQKILASM